MASTTSVFPLVTLLLQHSNEVHTTGYAAVVGRFLGRGRRKEHAIYFRKSAPFSLLIAFIPLLNVKRCLEGWIRLFPSLILGYLRLVSIPILP
jgi:Na+-driven multidrug efflux pump